MIRTNPIRFLRSLVADALREPDGVVRAPARLVAAARVLLDHGVRLPRASLTDLANRVGLVASEWPDALLEPGVVGLVVDEGDTSEDRGLVTPLLAEVGEWHVPSHLPFKVGDLQRLLMGLLEHATQASQTAVPEGLRFTFQSGLERDAHGHSMHVAGLLAILDVMAGRPDLLRRACAVVQPRGEGLGPVGHTADKLRAFRREYGEGTLLVYHPESTVEVVEFVKGFDRCWRVSSLGDLAQFAEGREGGPNLLAPLLARIELSADEVYGAHRFLRRLIKNHRFASAYGLAQRLLPQARRGCVSRPLRREVERSHLDLSRHLGYVAESVELARALAWDLAQPDAVTSYDEQAEADVVLAAALYHAHEFEAIGRVLAPWLARIQQDPLSLSPETRVKVQNTAARSLIAQETGGWLGLLEASERLLALRDPDDLPRTWCYRAHGHLRHGQLDEAERALKWRDGCAGNVLFARWTRAFLLADLSRRRGGKPFTDPELEQGRATGEFSLSQASYLQATARHPNCRDAPERFRRAAAALRTDAREYQPGNLLHGLASLLDLAAAQSQGEWDEARDRLRAFLSPNSSPRLYAHYRNALKELGASPDPTAVERLLT